MNSGSPPLRNIWRREKSSCSLILITASNLNSASKSKTVGRRRAVAMMSAAAVFASSDVAGRLCRYSREYSYATALRGKTLLFIARQQERQTHGCSAWTYAVATDFKNALFSSVDISHSDSHFWTSDFVSSRTASSSFEVAIWRRV